LVDRESVESICERIREDGNREIESIIEKARLTAAGIVEKAEGEAKEVADGIIEDGEKKGKEASRRVLSSVNIEVKRTKLKAREEVISEINRRVGDELSQVREGENYRDILLRLSEEAIGCLEGEKYIVYVDRRDRDIFTGRVLPELKKKVSKSRKGSVEVVVKSLEDGTEGGVKVGVPEGNVIFDNTFEARMYRLKEEIRSVIFNKVFTREGNKE
jgi:vacuolar-type H+-ATPase subunit E/Vma4